MRASAAPRFRAAAGPAPRAGEHARPCSRASAGVASLEPSSTTMTSWPTSWAATPASARPSVAAASRAGMTTVTAGTGVHRIRGGASNAPPPAVLGRSMATSLDELERLGDLLAQPAPSKRMLIIVNPYATTVSDRLKNLVVYALRGALRGRRGRDQAPRARHGAVPRGRGEGYDVVVAFGGDGTVNEAANGLAGSETPLTCLPGGSANVYCRMLGIPSDVVDATEHLLRWPTSGEPRAIDLGDVNGRKFVFAAGVGLDASVVERVDAHPRLKARLGRVVLHVGRVDTFTRRYLLTRRGWRSTAATSGSRA